MTEYLMSRARRLFEYADLHGSTGGGVEGRVASSMAGENTSVTIDESDKIVQQQSNNNNSEHSVSKYLRQRKRRRCILGCTVFCGLAALLIIVLTVRHDKSVSDALRKQLPAAFSSASSSSSSEHNNLRNIQLEEFLYGHFQPHRVNGTWVSDNEFLYMDSDGGLKLWDVAKNNASQIVSAIHMKALHVRNYKLSADKKYLLIKQTSHDVFRKSSYGHYVIYNVQNGNTVMPLRPTDMPMPARNVGFMVRYVAWAPEGNALVYVDLDNNIYYRRSVLAQDDKLTNNGEAGKIYNGIPDWVFEEEVFEDNFALWWSPDGTKLVWGSFDDSEVDFYMLPEYGPWQSIEQYPRLSEVRYPKVNGRNPTIQLWLANLTDESIEKKQILPPSSLANQGETHFSWVTWANQGQHFAVTWMNRVQNQTAVTLCSVKSMDCSSTANVIYEKAEQKGWIDYKYRLVFNPVPPNPRTKDFVVIESAPFLKHHYRQLVYYANGDSVFLTKTAGAEVTEILKWTRDGYIYYIATLPDQPGSRHLYRTLAPSSHSYIKSSGPECLTCNKTMTDLDRLTCNYYDVQMSKDGSFMIMTCLGPDVPYSCIHHSPSMHYLYTLEANFEVMDNLAQYEIPMQQYLNVPVSGSGQKARVRLFLPPNFDVSQKYPLVVNAYGGPGFQMVDDKWNENDYASVLAGTYGVVYAIVDPRGSGFQGDDWRFSVYRRFGTAEVQSLTEVTQYLQNNLSYIDASKTGVWGWSYGGYLSLMSLAKDKQNVFACGASVAPVVDWQLYDTYYTERYMGLPTEEDNSVGYNRSSVFHYLDNLRNKKYFVMHGTHDDNVHYQQSMLLSAALEAKDILFRQQAYPDQDHSIHLYHLHLYHTLTDYFVNDCFKI